jgi:hypothetical protein
VHDGIEVGDGVAVVGNNVLVGVAVGAIVGVDVGDVTVVTNATSTQ